MSWKCVEYKEEGTLDSTTWNEAQKVRVETWRTYKECVRSVWVDDAQSIYALDHIFGPLFRREKTGEFTITRPRPDPEEAANSAGGTSGDAGRAGFGPFVDTKYAWQLGDIRINSASIRINRVGLGPETDAKFDAFFDFASAMSRYGTLPTSNVEGVAMYLLQLLGAPTSTGDAGGIAQQYRDLMNKTPPFEVYVSFSYDIFAGHRQGTIDRFFFGSELWVAGTSTVNERLVGPLSSGLFIDRESSTRAGAQRLEELYNHAADNPYTRRQGAGGFGP